MNKASPTPVQKGKARTEGMAEEGRKLEKKGQGITSPNSYFSRTHSAEDFSGLEENVL